MKFIKLFLASSIVEFEHERQELAAYVNFLNNIYVHRGIFFELVICEDLSNAIAKERKQSEYNEYIRNSQYFYIIFGARAGGYTIEEFDVALKSFQESGAPKIYTYFMQLPEGKTAEASVMEFMNRIRNELIHFYSTFTHIDSIKLNLVMELCRDPLVGGQVTLEDGHAKIDGNEVLSMENIPLYSKNEAVQQLLKQKQELDEVFATLAALPDSESTKRLRLANSEKRNKIAEQLHTLEMDVLGLYQTVSAKRQLGQTLNWREQKAIELVDVGNYEGAKQILRDETWKQEVRQAETLIDSVTERIREYISGQKTLIQTLKSTGITQESEQEIIAIYEDITTLAQKHQTELDTLYDYARFLYDQKRFPKGIQVAETLQKCYALDVSMEDHARVPLLNLLGTLHHNQHHYREAETLYQEVLEICRGLAAKNPGAYEPYVADTCNNLATLLSDTGHYKGAELLYQEALEIRRRMAAQNPGAHESDVAMTCNNLANLLSDTGCYEESEALYKEALKVYRRLATQNPGAYEPNVAMSCNNLAILLKGTGHYAEAEPLYQEALEIYRRQAAQNPGAYEPDVATTCNNLANLLRDTGHHAEAEPLYREALEIYRRQATQNPGAYEPDVAMTCNNLANLLQITGLYAEAEPLYQEALEIRRRLAAQNPGAYEPYVATTCCNLAIFQFNIKKDKRAAKELFKEALTIYEKYPHLTEKAENIRQILAEYF